MEDRISWSWSDSLAAFRPDTAQVLRVEKILFELIRRHCEARGIREGTDLRLHDRTSQHVRVSLPCGALRSLEARYAWFLQVRPLTSAPPELMEAGIRNASSGGSDTRQARS